MGVDVEVERQSDSDKWMFASFAFRGIFSLVNHGTFNSERFSLLPSTVALLDCDISSSLVWHSCLEFMAPALAASNLSLPLPPWLLPTSARVHQYDGDVRKRKKSEDWTDEETDGADTTDAASVTDSVPAGQSLVLTPNESHQYRIAGLPFDQELPGVHFPHGPPKDEYTFRYNLPSNLLDDLSFLNPPIFPPQAGAYQGHLRLQHLGVLTTILHRCLLQGDYTRAGRAWGLILREEFRGYPMDVRSGGRWGIGAEILLRRGQQDVSDNAGHSSHNNSSVENNTPLPFTDNGFKQAKEYYERLILNHPYSKTAPHAVTALHFYPAMFGLWVYVAQEQSKVAIRKALNREQSSDHHSEAEENSSVDFDDRESSAALTAPIRARELDQAQQIASRMDSLLGSPPYSDSPELLELRGMVSLWIGDLTVSSLPTSSGDVELDPDAMDMDDTPDILETRRAHRKAVETRQMEVQKSKEFFQKAQYRGRSVAYNLEHFHLDDSSPFGDYEM